MKSNEQNQLDQILKDKLSEGTAPVPDFVWDRIEEELFPEKKRRGFFWWFFGGLGLLVMTGLFGITFSGEEAHSQNVVTSQNAKDSGREINAVNNTSIALDRNNTKGNLQSCNPGNYRGATSAQKCSDSLNLHRNQKSKQQASKLVRRKSMRSKLQTTNDLLNVSKFTNLLTNPNMNSTRKTNNSSPSNPLISEHALPEKEIHSNAQAIVNSASKEINSAGSKKLTYTEILALIKRDFSETQNEPTEKPGTSLVSIGVSGGPSFYNIVAFKDYFTSGQLSKRTFTSSGYELGLQTRFKVNDRFKVYLGLAFNQKQTQFSYNVAITQEDYFTYLVNGEAVPLANIRDDGANSCFLAKDVTVSYQARSVLLSLGTTIEFLEIGKFSAAVDLRLSGNLYSSLKLKEMKVLDIAQPQSEKWSYLQPGIGLCLNYRLNDRISLGLSPLFSKQFYVKESATRRLEELIIPVSVSFKF